TVQIMPAQFGRYARGDRALARGRGTVDRDHRYRLRDRSEHAEILWAGLVHAFWIVDAHATVAQRNQREAHRHAVIVVGVDRCRTQPCGRHDVQIVGTLLDRRTNLAQFDRHRRETVGFLDAPARDVAQATRAVGEQRGHG